MTALQPLLAALELAGSRGRRARKGWLYQCPAHDDDNPSLHVQEANSGNVLLHCFAGCTTGAVVASLGLRMADLFADQAGRSASWCAPRPPRPPREPATRPSHGYPTLDAAAEGYRRHMGPEHARWDYVNAQWNPVGAVLRWNTSRGKEVRPVSRLSDGLWHRRAMPEPRPLYRLPDLWEDKLPFVVVEGEKCADVAVRYGLNATTSAGGSKAAAKTDWSPLAGYPVVIIPDRDEAGDSYAETVATILRHLDPRTDVQLLELPQVGPGGDIADLIEMWRCGR